MRWKRYTVNGTKTLRVFGIFYMVGRQNKRFWIPGSGTQRTQMAFFVSVVGTAEIKYKKNHICTTIPLSNTSLKLLTGISMKILKFVTKKAKFCCYLKYFVLLSLLILKNYFLLLLFVCFLCLYARKYTQNEQNENISLSRLNLNYYGKHCSFGKCKRASIRIYINVQCSPFHMSLVFNYNYANHLNNEM